MLNVLSLFDGMSCGQIALERVGIKVNAYHASEIDKNSIKITQKNYPNTIQVGDINNLTKEKLEFFGKFDLLMGGSPCQNLSITVVNNINHNQGLEGKKSRLFYEYVRVLKLTNPRYFLFENVGSMKNKDKLIITKTLGINPIKLNSNLVSAQDRIRYYWTNIPIINLPEDRELVLKDIMQEASKVEQKYWYDDKNFKFHGNDKKVIATLEINGHDILKRVNNPKFKSPTLTACRGGNVQKKVYQIFDNRIGAICRKLTPTEYERLQTVPEGYTEGVADSHRYNMLGDGWTVDIIAHILKQLK